ncbi:MAG: T9SS type A sorting domain-containing protein [Balneolales bacterium]|nr:T9SS type A sorting domain-containing protein [Balneolales bacterium]
MRNYVTTAITCAVFLLSGWFGQAAAQIVQDENAQEFSLSVSISPEVIVPFSEVSVTFSADNASDLFFYGLEIGYDNSRFSFSGIQAGALMGENPLAIADNLSDSSIGGSVVRTSGAASGSGAIATFTFNVGALPETGEAQFAFSDIDVRNSAGQPIPDVEAPEDATVLVDYETFRVHYNNPPFPINGENQAIWDQVFVYAFSSNGGGEIAPFPGILMNEPEAGSVWYFQDIPDMFDRIIFADGPDEDDNKTEDLERNTDGWYDGTQWYDSEPDFEAERDVVFSVDMSAQIQFGNYNPEVNTVNVAGSFSGWSDVAMTASDEDSNIYEVSIPIIGPEQQVQFYKFKIDNAFELDGLPDREFVLGPANEQQVLDTVFYDNVPFEAEFRDVVFSVDMSVQQALGFFDPELDDVYLRGEFVDGGFEAAGEIMTASGDGLVYSVTFSVEGNTGSEVEFKYFVETGDSRDYPNDGWEILNGEGLNRILTLGPDGVEQVLDTVLFSNQELPPVRDVVFSVDMSVQQALGNFNPDEDPVYVRGSFNDWGAIEMIQGDELVYSVIVSVEGAEDAEVAYKFFAGDLADDSNYEGDVGPGGNRLLILGPADVEQVLETVFFNNNDVFPPSRNVTFSVDMSVQANGPFEPESGDRVFVRGDFNYFGLNDELFPVETGSLVYEVSRNVFGDEDQTLGYKFFVQTAGDREYPNDGWELLNGDPNLNRSLTLGPADTDQVLDTVFFNDDDGSVFVTVWPGDTNNDGEVNEADVLPLGIYWNQTGPVRENASTDWVGQEALVWDPVEATFADTDGSGRVNQTDLLAIGLNFGQTVNDADEESEVPPLASFFLPALNEGDVATITLRTADLLNIQGVSFMAEVFGASAESFTLTKGIALEWADEWKQDNRLLEFDLLKDYEVSGAKVHKGPTDAVSASEFISFTVTAEQNWSSSAELLIHRFSVVNENNATVTIDEIDAEITIELATSSETTELPLETALFQNYPNPFNPTTNIRFDLSDNKVVTIEVVNILGQRVAILADRQQMAAGTHTQMFDASRLTSGVYLIRMTAGEQSFTRKMMLVK